MQPAVAVVSLLGLRREVSRRSRVCTMVAGVVDVEVVMSKDAPGTGRGFCFVEFYNHSAAAHAKGVLGSETFRSGPTSSHDISLQQVVAVVWAKSFTAGCLPHM